ncbi:Crp/Fnr family transcriptional regulator [Erythrobacter sp. A6_0]|uniref:Crp/Fnr family transcriptional regulator n=1 Tax=Erythrobacter sp. A6_0 TaxID=2821089 RepID=UPI001ADC37DE|nr:Crp/Fnr family transcriptional regulator [Erythrobacter sp. A6_0]MBO9510891.1 Crp/Fnr family transcriptional regulator [Erythrobacter sp. A6_0]|tara:strand:- start:2533 stop:3306 length:774 start_codon:yes stop_codon:yes gene_type:complete
MQQDTSRTGSLGSVNSFLASLPEEDWKLLAARLSPVRFKNGDCLAHDTLDGPHVLFPLNLVACLQFTRQRSGLGLVGREGFFGWSAVLDDNSQDEVEATVLMDGGTALAISVEDMRQACLSSATLSLSLLRFLGSYTSQLAWMIRARDRGSLKERLCAWLLMLHDRVDSDFLRVTHGGLAAQLGVRRASVTDTLHVLEGEACLRCSRGIICLTDRARLQRNAGVSYETPRIAAKQAIPSTDTASITAAHQVCEADAV